MIRSIVQHPDARLREVCTPVLEVDADLRALAADMLETMYDAPGRGLAAPQVGVLARLFVMDATWKDGEPSPYVFINPEILAEAQDMQTNTEACLSIADTEIEVTRPAWVTLMWMDLDGEVQRRRFDGFEAACICHEIDHLHGRLIVDFEEAA